MIRGNRPSPTLLFDKDESVFLKGFAHELAESDGPRVGLYEGLPDALRTCLVEPAFTTDRATSCLWNVGGGWRRGTAPIPAGDDPDRSVALLALLSGKPEDYVRFASECCERELPLSAVLRIHDHEPLGAVLFSELEPEGSIDAVLKDAAEIGYRVVPTKKR